MGGRGVQLSQTVISERSHNSITGDKVFVKRENLKISVFAPLTTSHTSRRQPPCRPGRGTLTTTYDVTLHVVLIPVVASRAVNSSPAMGTVQNMAFHQTIGIRTRGDCHPPSLLYLTWVCFISVENTSLARSGDRPERSFLPAGAGLPTAPNSFETHPFDILLNKATIVFIFR